MSKKTYRPRNWKEYTETLVSRGSITFWFDEEMMKDWKASNRSGKRGRPLEYSDTAILCALTLRAIYHLSFRATEGFIRSLVSLLKIEMKVPDYTSLCKRQKELVVPLSKKQIIRREEKINIVIDSTGLKIYGEGEWKVRQHGWSKQRVWRKLHLGINSQTQEIEALEVTPSGIQDCQGFPLVIQKVVPLINEAIGDGAYDRFSCYELAEQEHFTLVAPPQYNARTSGEKWDQRKKASKEAVKRRDEVVLRTREIGAGEWKKEVKYHQRSLAETTIFRLKTLLGNRLRSRTINNQRVEAAIWCRTLNKITSLGLPNCIAVD
jgi:hypothetical protein